MKDFYTIYYIIYGLFTLLIVFDLVASALNKKSLCLKFKNFFIFIFLFFYYLLISSRDLKAGADTERYFNFYNSMYKYGDSIVGSDLGFNIFNKLLVSLGVTPSLYLFFVSLLFVVPVYYTFKQFKSINKVFLLWFFASLFVFISMSTNVLRQGIGGVFVMWGISIYLNRENKSKRFIIPLLIAPLFHISLILVILLFFISKYLKNIKLAYSILFISIVLSYIGFNLNSTLGNLPVVGNIFLDRMDTYLGENIKNYTVGFRIDFLFFNLFFVAIGYYISNMKIVKERYKQYDQIYSAYILLTSYFVLMFNIPFSDRFGILSWIFIPFVMFPIFDLSSFKYNKLKLGAFILGISLFIVFNVISV